MSGEVTEYTRELLARSHVASFAYDADRQLFYVGDRRFTPHDLPTGFGGLSAHDEVTEEQILDMVETVPLVHTFAQPIMLPPLYDWLERNLDSAVEQDTIGVMRETFALLQPEYVPVQKKDEYRNGLFGFDVSRLRSEHPHITLATLGNCACLGVDYDGIFGYRHWDEKIAGLSYHNVDTLAQRTSLLAGLGHLAYRAV